MKTVVVIGGGHAGVEAACAAATLGCRAFLITPDRGRIAMMSCNPSIGGIAKGTLFRELDAMGGVSAFSADRTAVQFRMLNMKKGPAVWGPRTQNDIRGYCIEQEKRLEEAGASVIEDIVVSLKGDTRIEAVVTQTGSEITGDAFVLAAGTFLNGILHRGESSWPGGRRGDISAIRLEEDLRKRAFHVKRFKTGTSPRVLRRSLDTAAMVPQEETEIPFRFSWRSMDHVRNVEKCWVVRTNRRTERIIADSLAHSPLYTGRITGKGPRYCPSFEDKVTKFPERTGHPIHVEPTGRDSRVMYVNGFSTSLPHCIQEKALRSIPGFEKAVISAYGYSVEYTCFEKGEYERTLRLARTENMYAAGQVLGTSGYEEASATGLLAGANAARNALGLTEREPDRMVSYLGVLVDDLVTRGAEEPYRLFSSRAENRLHLRQDNAENRLYEFGVQLGTVSREQEDQYSKKQQSRAFVLSRIAGVTVEGKTLMEYARRPEVSVEKVAEIIGWDTQVEKDLISSIVLDAKYQGYVERARRRHDSRERFRDVSIRWIGNFSEIDSLSIEASQVLNIRKPKTVREAEALSGVRQADIDALVVHVMKRSVSRET